MSFAMFGVDSLFNLSHYYRFKVKLFFIVLLTFIILVTSDIEHLFMCLLAIHVSSFMKYLFMSFAHLIIELFASYYSRSSLCTVDPSLVRHIICKYFLPVCDMHNSLS